MPRQDVQLFLSGKCEFRKAVNHGIKEDREDAGRQLYYEI